MTPELVVGAILLGALGAVARYAVTLLFAGRRLPWAVFAVNVAGSLIAGVVLGLVQVQGADAGVRFLVITGFCGGLTTFSTWTVETVQLALQGRWITATGTVLLNLAVGLAAAAGAWALVVSVAW